ncbi:hypothetical protein V6N11_051093 [Hibiscus sabdariffa]|uniref:RNase H type-1 domain-containing protein n=1 Tax=Hibiscus sabdariffa TaxID=183260 RepID=A0ABR2R2Z9_9ROSI
MAAVQGLLFAAELGLNSIILEGGARSVLSKLASNKIDYSKIGALKNDVKALSINFAICNFRFINRHASSGTHAMAMEGFSQLQHRYWIEEAPSLATSITRSSISFHVLRFLSGL